MDENRTSEGRTVQTITTSRTTARCVSIQANEEGAPVVDLGTVSLTGDEDGFLSRQCPSCQRVFKRPVHRIQAANSSAPYCPYCAVANDDDWETAAQQTYYQAAMDRAAMKYVHEQFNKSMGSIQSESLRFTPGTPDLPPDPGSPPPDPSQGFVRVDVPCHEDDPFKVAEATSGDVVCTVCGIPYPIGDVVQLGS